MDNQSKCDQCRALLSVVEAAGRETGTCNACLAKRAKRAKARELKRQRDARRHARGNYRWAKSVWDAIAAGEDVAITSGDDYAILVRYAKKARS